MDVDLGGTADNVVLIDNSGAITISATVTGVSRTLTLSGSGPGALTLSAANTYTGTTRLSAGILRAGDNAAFSTSTLALNSGTLASDGATARSFSNNVVFGGDVAFGDATGTGALNFSGTVNLGSGTRGLTTVVSTTFSGAVTNGNLTKAGAATLALTNAGNSFGALTVNTGTVSIGANTAVTGLAGSGGALNLSAGTLTVNQATSGTAALPFSGAGGFTKAGAGGLTLTGSSGGYAGTTTISGGSLVANGSLGGTVSVSSGGTLAGSGTVGAVTIDSGATLSPGNSPGLLTTGNMTWAGGGNYNWQLYDATLGAGNGWDLVSGGTLTITANPSSKFNVNLWSLASINPDVSGTAPNFSFTTTGTYTIGLFSSISGATGDWYTINTGSANGTGGFRGYNPALGGFAILSTGTSLDLVYTHTPLISCTWIAGAGLWSGTSNWAEADTPEGDAAIAFAGAGGLSTNDLLSGTGPNLLGTVTSLSFTGSASGSYTVAGNPLALGAGGITNDSASGQTISANVTLGAPASLTANGASLTFSGTIDTAGKALTLAGAAATSLGVVTGTGSLLKTDSGTATLTGAVSAPNVTISGGALVLGNANLLADTGSVTVGGGTLDLGSNADTVGSFAITAGTLAGSGTLTAATYSLGGGTVAGNLGPGAATSSAGNTTLAGTLAGNLTLAGGTVTLGSADRIASSSTVTINSGSLGLGAFNDTVGSFAITGGSLGGSGTLTAATYSLGGGTVAANLGAGTATSSAGNTTLAGTLAGNLTLAGGVVSLAAADRIG
ncbi:MAG: beta strand repeat-containing protein, partial [Planctomycetaceae bacterium]